LGFERSRLPHFLDNGLTDDGEVVSLTHWLPFTPRLMVVEIKFTAPRIEETPAKWSECNFYVEDQEET
jgi:hypothetical protein